MPIEKVLVTGSGGREYALGLAMKKDSQIYFTPGNGGTADIGLNVPIDPLNSNELTNFAKDNNIGLVVVGPEAPLVAGFADEATEAGLAVFGPKKGAALLEGSKAFSAEFNRRHNIPQPDFVVTHDYDQATRFARMGSIKYPVAKQDGLAAGKGVVVSETQGEALDTMHKWYKTGVFTANSTIVWQERLRGREVSIMAISDGTNVALFPPSRDYKRRLDGDMGLNTGGMGSIAPVNLPEHSSLSVIRDEIIKPAIKGIGEENHPFVGCLYAGLMITEQGPKVLEYNVRFGDPETQSLMMLLDSNVDLAQIFYDCTQGRLNPSDLKFRDGVASTVVIVAKDYPDSKYKKDIPLPKVFPDYGATISHAGIKKSGYQLLSNGGRILGVTGFSDASPHYTVNKHDSLAEAYEQAYTIVGDNKDLDFRTDIGS